MTQKVDQKDPILGFFGRWIDTFASHCDYVTVIGQQVGAYKAAENVEVISLEKEKGASGFAQVLRFWKTIIVQRKSYDRVLVHMTPIWIIIGAPVWILLRKKMYLWYEIKRGSWKLSIALLFVHKVFAASKHGLPTVAKKQVVVGHGIDVTRFTPDPQKRQSGHLVAIGRLTTVKHYEHILAVVAKLPECRLTIAGGTITESDTQTQQSIREQIHRLSIADRVEIGWVAPEEVPDLLQRADIMLHASQGGLDKVVLQAMACGCPVVSTSEAAAEVLPPECQATPETFLRQTQELLSLSAEDRQRLVKKLCIIVEEHHTLHGCIQQLVSHMQ